MHRPSCHVLLRCAVHNVSRSLPSTLCAIAPPPHAPFLFHETRVVYSKCKGYGVTKPSHARNHHNSLLYQRAKKNMRERERERNFFWFPMSGFSIFICSQHSTHTAAISITSAAQLESTMTFRVCVYIFVQQTHILEKLSMLFYASLEGCILYSGVCLVFENCMSWARVKQRLYMVCDVRCI